MDKKLNRMKELIEILNNASRLYYQYSTPIMTDFDDDKLYDELDKLETETNTILSNSPTQNVAPEAIDSLVKVEHPAPMLSLSKTKSISELASFLGNQEGLLSWKLDGLTIVLTYKDGKLSSGVTRGNGIIGEVITENVKKFKNIPLTIPYKGTLVVRGEAVIKYSDFNKMNEELDDDSSQYKNPRNLCSGSVRQLDSKVTAKRNVNCIIFALIESEKKFKLKSEEFEWLKSLGFDVVEYHKVTSNNLEEQVLYFKNKINEYDIPSDGLVLLYNDIEYGKQLGTTAKYPKNAIAFKWQDETAETKLIDVDWLVSRTGLINPVAVFEPVELEGTIVSRASLHNVSILQGLSLGIGDTILVYKANMIIPQIADNLTQSNSLTIPNKCPVCNHEARIISSNDVKYLYCMNDFCPAKLVKRLSQFTSRNAMNIEGLSDAIINKLAYEWLIKTYADIYNLKIYKNDIISFEGFGKKSYDNLINSIEKSRNVKLANFIFALGIPDIGLSRAKLIFKNYSNDINKIRNLTFEELSKIDGLGEIIAKEWIDNFNNEDFLKELELLLKEVNFTDTSIDNNQPLKDLIFVITGSVNNFTNRDELVEYIESYGGKVVKAISNNVNYLINNYITSTSTKNTKAKELGIKIISENDLMSMIQ